MNRKITIEERDDTQPRGGGQTQTRQPQGVQSPQATAQMGQRGDTQLAHVNPWEQALLKMLGGAGTTNPRTGLLQFYTGPNYNVEDWYAKAFGRLPDPSGLAYWQKEAETVKPEDMWKSFLSAGTQNQEAYTGWNPYSLVDSDLEIPYNVYPYDTQVSQGNKTDVSSSYSGLPTETSGLLQKALTPYAEGLSKFETPSGYLNAFNQFRQGLLGSFKPTYEKLISQSLAPLAQKGLLGGQTEDLMLRKITSDLSQSYDATALAETEKYVKNFIASIGGIGELLKYTQANAASDAEEVSYRESADPLAPYKLFAQMAAPWLGGGA